MKNAAPLPYPPRTGDSAFQDCPDTGVVPSDSYRRTSTRETPSPAVKTLTGNPRGDAYQFGGRSGAGSSAPPRVGTRLCPGAGTTNGTPPVATGSEPQSTVPPPRPP